MMAGKNGGKEAPDDRWAGTHNWLIHALEEMGVIHEEAQGIAGCPFCWKLFSTKSLQDLEGQWSFLVQQK